MIIFVLRHADKLRGQGQDGLDDKGTSRAELLARMLAESNVSRAYCSEAIRTLQTIEPLKRKLGASLLIEKFEGETHAAEVVAAVQSLPPETVVVVVSHTDTVPEIIAGLGGPFVKIADDQFDKLFVLFHSNAAASLVKLRYGGANTAAIHPYLIRDDFDRKPAMLTCPLRPVETRPVGPCRPSHKDMTRRPRNLLLEGLRGHRPESRREVDYLQAMAKTISG